MGAAWIFFFFFLLLFSFASGWLVMLMLNYPVFTFLVENWLSALHQHQLGIHLSWCQWCSHLAVQSGTAAAQGSLGDAKYHGECKTALCQVEATSVRRCPEEQIPSESESTALRKIEGWSLIQSSNCCLSNEIWKSLKRILHPWNSFMFQKGKGNVTSFFIKQRADILDMRQILFICQVVAQPCFTENFSEATAKGLLVYVIFGFHIEMASYLGSTSSELSFLTFSLDFLDMSLLSANSGLKTVLASCPQAKALAMASCIAGEHPCR